jgi:hypothetical protein
VTGAAAIVNIALNLILIPPYGMMGAAIATIAAYTTMFLGMAWWSQQIYPVAYQWRASRRRGRAASRSSRSASSPAAGCRSRSCSRSLYPLALFPLGFYLPPSGGRSAPGSASRARRSQATMR